MLVFVVWGFFLLLLLFVVVVLVKMFHNVHYVFTGKQALLSSLTNGRL